MVINKVAVSATKILNQKDASFKQVLKDKQENLSQKLGKALDQITTENQQNAQTLKSFMSNSTHSPEKLLAIQYHTGVMLLREQMFSKTAELCSNTFKSFTQMQV